MVPYRRLLILAAAWSLGAPILWAGPEPKTEDAKSLLKEAAAFRDKLAAAIARPDYDEPRSLELDGELAALEEKAAGHAKLAKALASLRPLLPPPQEPIAVLTLEQGRLLKEVRWRDFTRLRDALKSEPGRDLFIEAKAAWVENQGILSTETREPLAIEEVAALWARFSALEGPTKPAAPIKKKEPEPEPPKASAPPDELAAAKLKGVEAAIARIEERLKGARAGGGSPDNELNELFDNFSRENLGGLAAGDPKRFADLVGRMEGLRPMTSSDAARRFDAGVQRALGAGDAAQAQALLKKMQAPPKVEKAEAEVTEASAASIAAKAALLALNEFPGLPAFLPPTVEAGLRADLLVDDVLHGAEIDIVLSDNQPARIKEVERTDTDVIIRTDRGKVVRALDGSSIVEWSTDEKSFQERRFDAEGRQVSFVNSEGLESRGEFDARGVLLNGTVTGPKGFRAEVATTFAEDGRPLVRSVTTQTGEETVIEESDPATGRSLRHSFNGPKGFMVTTFNADGSRTKVVKGVADGVQRTFEIDPEGRERLVEQRFPDGKVSRAVSPHVTEIVAPDGKRGLQVDIAGYMKTPRGERDSSEAPSALGYAQELLAQLKPPVENPDADRLLRDFIQDSPVPDSPDNPKANLTGVRLVVSPPDGRIQKIYEFADGRKVILTAAFEKATTFEKAEFGEALVVRRSQVDAEGRVLADGNKEVEYLANGDRLVWHRSRSATEADFFWNATETTVLGLKYSRRDGSGGAGAVGKWTDDKRFEAKSPPKVETQSGTSIVGASLAWWSSTVVGDALGALGTAGRVGYSGIVAMGQGSVVAITGSPQYEVEEAGSIVRAGGSPEAALRNLSPDALAVLELQVRESRKARLLAELKTPESMGKAQYDAIVYAPKISDEEKREALGHFGAGTIGTRLLEEGAKSDSVLAQAGLTVAGAAMTIGESTAENLVGAIVLGGVGNIVKVGGALAQTGRAGATVASAGRWGNGILSVAGKAGDYVDMGRFAVAVGEGNVGEGVNALKGFAGVADAAGLSKSLGGLRGVGGGSAPTLPKLPEAMHALLAKPIELPPATRTVKPIDPVSADADAIMSAASLKHARSLVERAQKVDADGNKKVEGADRATGPGNIFAATKGYSQATDPNAHHVTEADLKAAQERGLLARSADTVPQQKGGRDQRDPTCTLHAWANDLTAAGHPTSVEDILAIVAKNPHMGPELAQRMRTEGSTSYNDLMMVYRAVAMEKGLDLRVVSPEEIFRTIAAQGHGVAARIQIASNAHMVHVEGLVETPNGTFVAFMDSNAGLGRRVYMPVEEFAASLRGGALSPGTKPSPETYARWQAEMARWAQTRGKGGAEGGVVTAGAPELPAGEPASLDVSAAEHAGGRTFKVSTPDGPRFIKPGQDIHDAEYEVHKGARQVFESGGLPPGVHVPKVERRNLGNRPRDLGRTPDNVVVIEPAQGKAIGHYAHPDLDASKPMHAADFARLRQAIVALHRAGLAHGDLKTYSNIHLHRNAGKGVEFTLIDFGGGIRKSADSANFERIRAQDLSELDGLERWLRSEGKLVD